MAAATHNIVIEKGATLKLPLRLKDSLGVALNLTGYSGRMQVRESLDNPLPALNLTTAGGHITVDAQGLLYVKASAALTDALTITAGVYDLELEAPNGDVDRLLEGRVRIKPAVTR